VYLTHGQQDVLARYLREVEGLAAEPLRGELASRPDLEAQLDVEPDGTHTSSPSSASP
jgi:putative mRNA 3-end processing factor